MFLLPKPGKYLPVVEEKAVSEMNATSRIDKTENAPSVLDEFEDAGLAPLASYAVHQMSYQETYMDRALSVTRPGLQPE